MKNEGKDELLLEVKEQLSAYMDDALDEQSKADFLAQLKSNPELQAIWQRFHLIQSALSHKSDPMLLGLGAMLSARVSAEIAKEPERVWGAEFDKAAVVHSEAMLDERNMLNSK